MAEEHNDGHSLRTRIWIDVILVVFGGLFSGFAWYVTQPKTTMGQVSTLSFGFGLVILIGLLAYFDEMMQTRWGRFFVDCLFGLAIVALLYVFMIGLTVYWQVIAIGGGVVLLLASLFAVRKPLKAKPHHVTRDPE